MTNTDYEILSLGQLYRDRADASNAFDELKNQWGWGGFTTHDLHRCQFAARAVALIYNWWSLFVRLANYARNLRCDSDGAGLAFCCKGCDGGGKGLCCVHSVRSDRN